MKAIGKTDRRAGYLSGLMLVFGFFTLLMSLGNWEKFSFPYQMMLFLSMASPLVFPLLAIVLIRQVSKVGAGLLLVSVLALLLMISAAWVFISGKIAQPELATGLAVELVGAMFTAIAIVLIEQAIEKFMD